MLLKNCQYCNKQFKTFKSHNKKYCDKVCMGNSFFTRNSFEEVGESITVKTYSIGKEYSFIIDKEDWDRIKNMKWTPTHSKRNKKKYIRAEKRQAGKKNRKTILLHRFIMGVDDSNIYVDHINGNTLDNRKENLRLVNSNRNTWNVHDSRIRGVYRKHKKWVSYIGHNKKKIFLGSFIKREDAIITRVINELKFYGKYSPFFNYQEDYTAKQRLRNCIPKSCDSSYIFRELQRYN